MSVVSSQSEHNSATTGMHRPSDVQHRSFSELEMDSDDGADTVVSSEAPAMQKLKISDRKPNEALRAMNRQVARLKFGVSGIRRSSCEGAGVYSAPNSPNISCRRTSAETHRGFQRCLSSPNKIQELANQIGSAHKPEHGVDEEALTRGRSQLGRMDFDTDSFSDDQLAELILDVFLELRLDQHLNIAATKLKLFVACVRLHMFNNPYHNWTHVADVFQACYALGLATGLLRRLSPLEQFALLISALCHDLEHPGVNNLTLIKSKPELSELYGESANLEKHHSLRAFSLMLHREVELLSGMDTAEYYRFRDMVTRIILATDMSRHAEYCAKLKHFAADATAADHQQEMEILLKCADTSNVLRPMAIAKRWAVKIGSEFFAQGDMERSMGLDVTPTCDRRSQTLVGLQKGFIDFCIGPYFDAVGQLWPCAQDQLNQVWRNRKAWEAYNDTAFYAEMSSRGVVPAMCNLEYEEDLE